MSSPLTLLSLSLMNPLPSGALMLTGMMGFERHELIGCGWDGTAWVAHSAPPMDGPLLFWVADDPLCDGWWMVDGVGAGSCGLGWPRLDGVLPLTLTHSPVSRLSSLAMVGMATVLSM